MPGHGRAFADSHKELPTVHADLDTLDAWDFAPFKALSDMPIAMTAHVVFTAIDRKRPATQSKKAIKLIRQHLGFNGLLLSDDLVMNALSGTLTERAEASLTSRAMTMLTPAAMATAHSPRRNDWIARCTAVSADEHAVSTASDGPRRPS